MGRAPLVKGMEILAADGESMFVRDRGPRVDDLSESDDRKLDRQRRLVGQLARRHVGRAPGGSEADDLRILQDLLDDGVIATDAVFEQQALGVVLGDIMVRELGYQWVVVDDDFGRSRALRIGERGDYIYPVTMISKRYEKGIPVVVEELYAKARSVAESARARRRR
jgi:hypothetical protein